MESYFKFAHSFAYSTNLMYFEHAMFFFAYIMSHSAKKNQISEAFKHGFHFSGPAVMRSAQCH